ncbi:MAG: LamG-like jellyroll fold domain-containing protein [Fibrobacteria bacterium]
MAIVCAAPSNELLHLDFNDSAEFGAQPGALPAGTVNGAAKPSAAYPGSADFGPQGGWIHVPGFHSPTGPFTIEARFLIRNYGPENARFISDIFSTATWDDGTPQGLEMKVGGGYLYPTLPRSAYRTEADWVRAQYNYSYIDRGGFSGCFAAFFMSRKDAPSDWKAVYTDRCIEKNKWTHLVGVWDGTDMRIYLDGSEATDKWRIQGKEAAPSMDSVVGAYAGAGFDATRNHTYLDGILDYVKVEEGALSDFEIHKRYQNNFDPQVRDSLCITVIHPHYPEPGQPCKGRLDLEFKITKHGACTDTAYSPNVAAGDSAEIEISKDPSFTDLCFHKVAGVSTLHIEAGDLPDLAGYEGALYWRVRLTHGHSGASAKISAQGSEPIPGDWSLSRPLIMNMSETSAIGNHAFSLKPFHFQWQRGLFLLDREAGSAPVRIDPAGKQQLAPLRNLGD